MGGKPRSKPETRRDPKTGEIVTEAQIEEADAWVARHVASGARELVGDEARAARAADELRRRIEEALPFPQMSAGADASAFAEAMRLWRADMDSIEASLRGKAAAARKAASAVDELLRASSDDEALLPPLKRSLESALNESRAYEMFARFALQLVCRKGGNRGDKSDQAPETAAFLLYLKGESKARIARLLGKDRRDVTRWLAGADEFRDDDELRRLFLGE